MSRLAPVDCRKVKALLKKLGFEQVPTNHGSHEKWRHPSFNKKQRNVTVDCPKAPFDAFLMGSMANQAGMKKREFWKACLGHICHEELLKKYTSRK